MRPHQYSVAEVRGSSAGSRTFHTMTVQVQGNCKCCGPRVSAPEPKALKPGVPNVSRKSIGWFLSQRVVITYQQGGKTPMIPVVLTWWYSVDT
ncbi:hypothetical protein V6N13_101520 [Hibiscus sabdariffa]|uniref:Uncharacterized protein n=1 Tax=Hibiscus sabdariffa TaxID=183260 RepID=A0ABR2QLR0_9ROSI